MLLARVNAARGALRQDRAENVVLEFVGQSEQLRRAWDDLPPSRQRAIASALVEEIVIWPAPNLRPQSRDRMLIWWRGEPRPATPRGARQGIAERRAAGQFNRCSVTGCAEPYVASGFCSLHLQRMRIPWRPRHGRPKAGGPLSRRSLLDGWLPAGDQVGRALRSSLHGVGARRSGPPALPGPGVCPLRSGREVVWHALQTAEAHGNERMPSSSAGDAIGPCRRLID